MLKLANQIYGGAFDSRLVRNIREEKGYTYSPQSVFQAMGQAGLYRAVADVRNDVTGATLKEIYAEIDKLRAGGPEAEELDDAKVYARGLFVLQNATQTGLADTLNTMYTLRPAEGLSGDVPAADLAAVARGGQDRRADAARLGGLGRRDRRRLHEGQGPAGGFANITFVDLDRQADPRAEVDWISN